jgi:penicillin-binding protein 1A
VRRRHPRAVFVGASILAAAVIVLLSSATWFAWGLWRELPDREAIARIGDMAQTTRIFDRHDRMAFTIYREQRIEVPLAEMSPDLVRAFLAIEDKRFYDHRGFDLPRIVSAAIANIREGRRGQGGSTITQQLARLSFLTPDKTFRRKLQELVLAARIERQYTKDRILELYLNKAYFGDGLYGVEAAARGYFGRHASEVTLAEAALLAGLMRSPSTYAPTVNMERAIARRNLVLRVMHDDGLIDAETYEAARASKVALQDGLQSNERHGRYFKEQVRRELVDLFGAEKVYEGGLRVFSTIDPDVQALAEVSIADGLAALEKRVQAASRRARGKGAGAPQSAEPLQGALVALDPGTGHVLAMVGGRDFDASSFNRAVQARRQPGSAFKPFIFAAALEAGFTPASIIDRLNDPVPTLEGAWTPDDGHSTEEMMTLRTALRTSSNRAAVRLLQEVGIPRAAEYAERLGVDNVPRVPSLALGSGEVTLQTLTAAYAAFANGGEVPAPILIRRVEDRSGTVLYEARESLTRAVTEVTAFQMATMLADVIDGGTAWKARSAGFNLPAGGKTGTTNDFRDAWFVGFTPSLVAGVWVGYDQPRTILPDGFAGDLVVPLWAGFMRAATKGHEREWLRPPAGLLRVNVCRMSGKLASEGCASVEVASDSGELRRRSMIYTEHFVAGTEPVEVCDLHANENVLRQIAAAVTGSRGRADKPATGATADVPAAPPAAQAPAEVEEPPPPKKKRGFWARLFGIGGDGNRERDRDRESGKMEDRDDGETDRTKRRGTRGEPRDGPGD